MFIRSKFFSLGWLIFFLKEPQDGSVLPWHQDIQYWPLFPANAVTVWLALYVSNEENGAMKVVKGSHKQGMFKHITNKASNLVLNQEVSINKPSQKGRYCFIKFKRR